MFIPLAMAKYTFDLQYLRPRAGNMMIKKQRQCKWEYEMWKQSLSFLLQDCVHLKNRLSEIAHEEISNEMLTVIEALQNTILEKEAVLLLMRSDINTLAMKIASLPLTKTDEAETLFREHRKMRTELALIEKSTTIMRLQFNEKLFAQL